ncbi:tetratricopeptide repeat protein [Prevotella sp. MA2016]|uniref:tetratricopeptide repeat protein n=1 Tax=Prevotella sp. MA2016 TaxID=1408310 RepID=UPI000569AB07|nr:tetratricopeptide repeat protein [Prevotella sp. MA2016]
MKKLFVMAAMMVASATAFAGDSDALKAILKAKTYAEAEALVKSSLGSLANDAEKAKAYNKLVDLALNDFSAQSAIQTENQVNKQMGKEEKPVDMKLMNDMAYNAIVAAMECDKFDQKPNEKGKVAPKFASKNAQRLWGGPRNTLVNAGQDALTAKDNATARKFWQLFVESDAATLFKEQDREQQKPFFGQVARFASIFAYQDKDMAKALELADVAMKDPEEYENALNLKLEILGDGLKTKDDSVKYCASLKDIYAEHKVDGVMEKLYNTLLGLGQTDEANKILDDALAANPNNFVALADKGLSLLQANKASEAVPYLKKAFEVKPDNAIIATYAGTGYSVQAQETEDPAKKKELYKQAIELFDKAKELDPDMLQAKWGYNRYNAYYNYYGADAPETKQAEQDSH